MKRGTWALALIMALLLACPFQVFAGAPLDSIQKEVNELLKVLGDPALKAESAKAEKEKKIWAIADNIFNYYELSRRTLGRDWRKLNADQQKEFVDLFSKFLANIYMGRILEYTNEKVDFIKEMMLSDDTAEVQSEIVTSTKKIPINYRMILRDGRWEVYDVIIEGISMVRNYRSQFRQILSKESPEELLKTLREKTK